MALAVARAATGFKLIYRISEAFSERWRVQSAARSAGWVQRDAVGVIGGRVISAWQGYP
jgi:hypothetical protein